MRRAMKRLRNKASTGQAISEVLIGLVGLAVMFFGLVQVGRLGNASITNLLEARRAAAFAMRNTTSTYYSYVRDWADGPDALSHTPDDIALGGGGRLTTYEAELAGPVDITVLHANPAARLNSDVPGLMASDSLAVAADLRHGVSAQTIELERPLRLLLLNNLRTIAMEDRVVMPGITFLAGVR